MSVDLAGIVIGAVATAVFGAPMVIWGQKRQERASAGHDAEVQREQRHEEARAMVASTQMVCAGLDTARASFEDASLGGSGELFLHFNEDQFVDGRAAIRDWQKCVSDTRRLSDATLGLWRRASHDVGKTLSAYETVRAGLNLAGLEPHAVETYRVRLVQAIETIESALAETEPEASHQTQMAIKALLQRA